MKTLLKLIFPQHQCQNDIESFSSIAGYYRHVKSFNDLKQSLTTTPVFIYPNFKETFQLTTDASEFTSGAVFSQGQKDLPIDHGIKKLCIIETKYSIIVWTVKYFRSFLYGRKFILTADHRTLTWPFDFS